MRRVRALPPEKKEDFNINEQQAFKSTLDPVKNSIAIAGLFITGLSLFVGAIGIMNITFVSVKERTKEIGTRKALGARRRTILLQFLIESTALCLLGGLIGLIFAYLMCFGMAAAFLPSRSVFLWPGRREHDRFGADRFGFRYCAGLVRLAPRSGDCAALRIRIRMIPRNHFHGLCNRSGANKLRSALTMIGITIGVFSVISVMTAIGAMQGSIESGFSFLARNFPVCKIPSEWRPGWSQPGQI